LAHSVYVQFLKPSSTFPAVSFGCVNVMLHYTKTSKIDTHGIRVVWGVRGHPRSSETHITFLFKTAKRTRWFAINCVLDNGCWVSHLRRSTVVQRIH